MSDQPRRPGSGTLLVFAAAVTIGGGNFLAVRFSNRQLAPFWGAGVRFGLACLLFTAVVLVMRLPWPRGPLLQRTLVYGVLSFFGSYAFLYWSLVRVTAGVAVVVLAVVPLATLLLAVAQGFERLHGRAAAGALLALLGIGWMALDPGEVVVPVTALAAMLAGALCAAQGVIVGKQLSAQHPAVTNAVALGAGSLLLLALSLVTGEPWALPTEPEVLWAVAYLVTLGSVGMFVLVLLLVRRWTASATSYLFVLFPVVTLGLGPVVADEPISAQAATGAVVVMAGVWFGALSPAARRGAAAAAARRPAAPG